LRKVMVGSRRNNDLSGCILQCKKKTRNQQSNYFLGIPIIASL
jgi:hypothetical protein